MTYLQVTSSVLQSLITVCSQTDDVNKVLVWDDTDYKIGGGGEEVCDGPQLKKSHFVSQLSLNSEARKNSEACKSTIKLACPGDFEDRLSN